MSSKLDSYDYAPRSLGNPVAVTGRVLFVKSAVAHAHAKKTPVSTNKVSPTQNTPALQAS